MIESKLDSEDAAERSDCYVPAWLARFCFHAAPAAPELLDRLLKATRKLLIEHLDSQS